MKRGSNGFTLIEVMVAAAVMGIAAVSLLSLLAGSLANIRTAQDLHRYQLAGEEVMNRVLLLSALPAGGRIEGKLERLGARWTVTLVPWIPRSLDLKPPEAVMKVDVRVEWQGRSGPRVLRLETLKGTRLSYEKYDFQNAIEAALPQ